MEFRIEKKPAQSITAEQWKEMHAPQNIDSTEIVSVSYDADGNF